MMLSVYTIDQANEWDNIIRSFSKYDTYWLSGYIKAFQIHGDGCPLMFYYNDGKTRGVNVVMKRDIAESEQIRGKLQTGTCFDLSTPYGYGGWLIEGENPQSLFAEYDSWCFKNNIVSEFVRFHPVIKNHIKCKDSYMTVPLGQIITMDLSSPEVIWSNFTSQNRNKIKKAQKNGIRIYNGRYPEIYEVFRNIYNDTMDNNNADKYYYFDDKFYESILNDLPYNAQIFYAVYEKKIIAASIFLTANNMINYHLSGLCREFSSLAPTNLLLYEVALWGHYNGYKSLYLGGGVGSAEDALFIFKKSFYRLDDLNRFYIGKKIINQEKYDMLVNMRSDLSECDFFPKYRA